MCHPFHTAMTLAGVGWCQLMLSKSKDYSLVHTTMRTYGSANRLKEEEEEALQHANC
jgi:hypothetical protein